MKIFFYIFTVGLVGISYPMKGEVTTPALSFVSHENKMVTMEETWEKIEGYEYEVSSTGKVRSLDRITRHTYGGTAKRVSKILSPNTVDGYHIVILCKNGINKSMRVHRLVAQAFIPNPDNKPQVNHKNSIRTDNRVENLEWCTCQENIIHGYKYGSIKPTEPWKGKFGKDHHASKVILQMDDFGNVIEEHIGICEAARKTGLQQSNISKCCLGIKKHSGGYVWKYKS